MSVEPLHPTPLAEIRAARERLAGHVLRTPLMRLALDLGPGAPAEIHLKLENLQPIGSFKLRGAGNAILAALEARSAPHDVDSAPHDSRSGGHAPHWVRAALADGVTTASAGNMAQGVAWHARRLGLPCRVIVPEHAPRAKLDAIERLGGEIFPVPFDDWWRALLDGGHESSRGLFVHPVCDPLVVAGNGTIGLEILEDLPDVDAVVVPYGGGGLAAGIASALRALSPRTQVFAAEVSTAAPFAAALAAGKPVDVAYTPSFVDGIGGKCVLPPMWPMVRELLAGSLLAELDEVASAVRMLVERNHVVAEGAGATSVAAALKGGAGRGKVVCIVSGGNLDAAKLATILRGDTP